MSNNKRKLLMCVLVLVFSVGFFSNLQGHGASLNKANATIYVGSTFNLKVSGTSAQTWKSSKKKIATVSSKGVVRAKAAGTCNITVFCKNGKKYTCKVTVTPHNCVLANNSKAATNHKDTDDATCGHGTIKYYTCTACLQDKSETLDDKLTHSFETEHEEKLSCVQDGYTLKRCSKCGEYDEVRPKATGHDYSLSKDGKSIICSKCGSIFTPTAWIFLSMMYLEQVNTVPHM